MSRGTFEREIGRLEDRLLALGSLVEKALQDSARTLKYRDMKRGHRLIADDRIINQQRYDIEQDVLALIAMQQPIEIAQVLLVYRKVQAHFLPYLFDSRRIRTQPSRDLGRIGRDHVRDPKDDHCHAQHDHNQPHQALQDIGSHSCSRTFEGELAPPEQGKLPQTLLLTTACPPG